MTPIYFTLVEVQIFVLSLVILIFQPKIPVTLTRLPTGMGLPMIATNTCVALWVREYLAPEDYVCGEHLNLLNDNVFALHNKDRKDLLACLCDTTDHELPWPDHEIERCLEQWKDGYIVKRPVGFGKYGESCWWCPPEWGEHKRVGKFKPW